MTPASLQGALEEVIWKGKGLSDCYCRDSGGSEQRLPCRVSVPMVIWAFSETLNSEAPKASQCSEVTGSAEYLIKRPRQSSLSQPCESVCFRNTSMFSSAAVRC